MVDNESLDKKVEKMLAQTSKFFYEDTGLSWINERIKERKEKYMDRIESAIYIGLIFGSIFASYKGFRNLAESQSKWDVKSNMTENYYIK